MLVSERNTLTPVKVLISNSLIHLELFENVEGSLFLSSPVSKPEGTVYYSVTASLLYMFLGDLVNLQTLLDASSSLFVEISSNGKTTLYSRKDIKAELKCGDKTRGQLT